MVKENFPESIACYESLIVSSMSSFGLKTVETKIYAHVFCSIEPVSLEDISSSTGYSLATVSTVAKYLSDMNILKRVKKPGTKKVFLAAQRDVSEMLIGKFTMALDFIVKPKKESLPDLISSLKKDIRQEKSLSRKNLGKSYLELLEHDLEQTLLLEKLHTYIIEYINKTKKQG
ncbi:hypothetical protein JXA48_00375 [Candidatus Woesearchaeota archaeon]|nr:hypothetical protein [Candidatus Woesearchaeota archaeon]